MLVVGIREMLSSLEEDMNIKEMIPCSLSLWILNRNTWKFSIKHNQDLISDEHTESLRRMEQLIFFNERICLISCTVACLREEAFLKL